MPFLITVASAANPAPLDRVVERSQLSAKATETGYVVHNSDDDTERTTAFSDIINGVNIGRTPATLIGTSIHEMKGDRDGKSVKRSATRNCLVQL